MKSFKKILSISTVFLLSLLFLQAASDQQAVALQEGETIIKSKNLELLFDEENPEGNVDLKKIVEEELVTPPECENTTVICQIKSVGFEMRITKEWLKLDLAELDNYSFANTAAPLDNPVDKLEDSEVVILQETLARRGLLQYLDGEIVKERGFFGALTWMGLLRLAQIKEISDKDPGFTQLLTDEVNTLMRNMAIDEGYVGNKPLPKEAIMTPQEGDDLFDLWNHYKYLAQLAQDAEKVDPGEIQLKIGNDVDIDGFVNVERVR